MLHEFFVQVIEYFCISFFSCFLQNTKDNPPCNTLFIGNLGENVNEEELRGLFSVYASLIFAQFSIALSCLSITLNQLNLLDHSFMIYNADSLDLSK